MARFDRNFLLNKPIATIPPINLLARQTPRGLNIKIFTAYPLNGSQDSPYATDSARYLSASLSNAPSTLTRPCTKGFDACPALSLASRGSISLSPFPRWRLHTTVLISVSASFDPPSMAAASSSAAHALSMLPLAMCAHAVAFIRDRLGPYCSDRDARAWTASDAPLRPDATSTYAPASWVRTESSSPCLMRASCSRARSMRSIRR
mmetsp:Transcript_8895/g.18835  ORF Transcript_8895/g.18835 Transcript_8895/m.18835 type:complete len:206 (-) Transcript_8895:609-1226(-)